MKNRRVKQVISTVIALCLCLGGLPMAGSRSAALAQEAQEDEAYAKGRYLESEASLPEQEGGWLVHDLVRLDSGVLRIAAESGADGAVSLWESSDLGENWEQTVILPEEIKSLYIRGIALSPKGGGACLGMVFTDGEMNIEFRLFPFDEQGNGEVLEFPDEEVQSISFTADGRLLGMNYSGSAFLLDSKTGEVEDQLASSEVEKIGSCGKEALLLTSSQALLYDLDDGEPSGRDEALENALLAGNRSYLDETTYGHPIVFAEDEEGRFYYCTHDGIFSHVIGGSVVEQVVDGALCSLNDPNVMPVAMEAAGGVFLLTYVDVGGDGNSRLLRYTYDPEAASTPQNEILVYSLHNNDGLRQCITTYQKQHPDTYVNYEVGMSGEDGVTAADALRTLNTDILANNGPDVLILDGMSVDTYAGKGLLADLSEILDEISQEEGLLEKIAYTWKTEEGIVPAVPVQFGLNLAAGSKDILEQMEDLDALEELTREAGVLGWTQTVQLPEILYYICVSGWEREDHTIDPEKLTEYVTKTKQIYDNCYAAETDTGREYMERWAAEFQERKHELAEDGFYFGDLTSAGLYYASGAYRLSLGLLSSMTSYSMLTSAMEGREDEQGLKLFGGEPGIFLPMCQVSILNTGRNQENARDFVKYLLSKEGELVNNYYGFPVNRAALEELVLTDPHRDGSGMVFSSSDSSTGEMVELVVSWPKQEQLDWLLQAVENLSERADLDEIRQEAVTQEARRCLQGEISADEAVDAILQRINLYLAESGY